MNYLKTGGSLLKYFKKKSQLLMIALVAGFLFGIIYTNIVVKRTGVITEIFHNYILERFEKTNVVSNRFLLYVIRTRLLTLFTIVLAGCLKWKKTGVILWCGWTGFLFGTLIVSSIIQMGAKGLLVSVAGMFPHMLFYIPASAILLVHIYSYPQKQWNWSKTIFVILTVFIGMVLECYMNPIVMKIFMKIV